MKLVLKDDFDIVKIADSGQCFRLNPVGEKQFHLIAGKKQLFIEEGAHSQELFFDCNEQEFQQIWRPYFDLDTEYRAIRKMILTEDCYLTEAAEFGKGIRILRQDPWEMLITFILSQRKSIPAIKKAVELLCQKAGDPIGKTGGQPVYSFPAASQLAGLSMEELQSCGLGYRAPYVKEAAQRVAQGQCNLAEFDQLDNEQLHQELLKFFGVGTKVANCVMLFGFHRLNSFPRDVWINRVIDRQYDGEFKPDVYAPYEGVIQQYMFYYARG